MANHKNDHELTTVTLREEVDRALEAVLPSGLGKQARLDAVSRFERIFEKYSSPFPHPEFLRQVEGLAPGATKQIIDASIQDLEHRRLMDAQEMKCKQDEIALVEKITLAELRSVGHGRIIGFLAYLATLVFAGVAYYMGSEKLAIGAFGAAALGIVVQLIKGGQSSVVVSAEDEPKSPKSK